MQIVSKYEFTYSYLLTICISVHVYVHVKFPFFVKFLLQKGKQIFDQKMFFL